MVSSKQRIVSESRDETPVPSGPPEPTVKCAYEHFHEYGRHAPWHGGPVVFGNWVRTRLETQDVVSGHVDHPASFGSTRGSAKRCSMAFGRRSRSKSARCCIHRCGVTPLQMS